MAQVDKGSKSVMVGISTYAGHSYCRQKFIENTKRLVGSHEVVVLWNGPGKPRKLFPKSWKIKVVKEIEGERAIDLLARKNNIQRDIFLASKHTHFFMLESDNFPPVGTIERFLKHEKPVISGIYFIDAETKFTADIPNPSDPERRAYIAERYGAEHMGKSMFIVKRDLIPSIWGISGDGEGRLWKMQDLFPQRGLVKILASGIGVVLIERSVMEKFDFRIWDEPTQTEQFTDFNFYHDCYINDIPVYADTDIIANHIHPEDEIAGRDKWFNARTRKFTRTSQVMEHNFADSP